MTIIVTTPDNRTVKLRPQSVDREDVLQRYIHDHPESLPLEEIHEDIRLCVLCREFPTSSGPIVALGVDQAGEVYIIETKLFKNPDKRTVIAQALDYVSVLKM
jgi:RecB family endonuclease NucS